jgi:F-box/leucine-rich repeat protein 2/20
MYLVADNNKKKNPAIMKVPNLQVLTLVGCIGIDALDNLEKGCSKSLQAR